MNKYINKLTCDDTLLTVFSSNREVLSISACYANYPQTQV